MGLMAERPAGTLPSVFLRGSPGAAGLYPKGLRVYLPACTRPGPWFLMAKG